MTKGNATVKPAASQGDTLPSAPKALADKTASEVEIIRWVAQNIDNPKVTVKSCPAPFAWTLLRQCRGNDAFISWFTDKLWSKLIPTRAQFGDEEGVLSLDGTQTLEVLDKLSAISKAAKASVEEEDAA